MVGWILQWNGYDPAFVGTVKVVGLSGLNGVESNVPSFAVMVCASTSLLTSFSVEPAAAVIGGNLYPCTTISWDVAPVAEDPAVAVAAVPVELVAELPPHDVRKSATPAATEIAS